MKRNAIALLRLHTRNTATRKKIFTNVSKTVFSIVTYHCTVLHGIEGGSWRPDETEAGTLTCLKFKKTVLFIFSLSLFVSRCSAYKNEHRKRILGRQAAKSTQRAPLIFFYLPSSASQSFWIAFGDQVERGPEWAEFLEVGRSAPSLSLSVVAVARRQQPNVAAHLELHPRF